MDLSHVTVDANSEPFAVTAEPQKAGLRRWLRPALGLLISGFFLYAVLRSVSLSEVWTALERADLKILPLAVLSLGCGYALRITRWWIMLRTGVPRLAWTAVAAPFLISIAANNVMPLRLGDFLRLFAFRERRGGEPSRVAGTLLVERLLDLGVLLAIFALVTGHVAADGPFARILLLARGISQLGIAAACMVFALPLLDRWLFARLRARLRFSRHGLILKLLGMEEMLAGTIARIGRPGRLVALLAISVLLWALEGGLFVITLSAFQSGDLNVTPAIFAFVVATLATLVPSSPGYIGTFHFFAIQALLAFNIDQNTAAAFAITAHLMLWLPTTLAGLIAFCAATWLPKRTLSLNDG